MLKPGRPENRKTFAGGFLVKACVMLFFFGVGGLGTAYAGLTIQPTTWNVVGLDSNNTSVGPNTFPIGVRVCNTGAATVTNVSATYVWDSANIYISLSGPSAISVPSLAAGACTDFYFSVTILRTVAAYNAARRYHITVTGDSVASVSTPTPREIYVERIISQSRNSINSISGPTTVYVGQTYNYTVNASTATGGYAQLEAFLELPNIIFQIQSISTTYTAPPGATNDKFYADACGWDNNPLSPNYLSCIGPANYPGGKAGGTVVTTYTVKILTTGTTTASTLVLDFSGSSYHYNNDYGTKTITITALPPPLTLSKISNPTSLSTGGTVDYTLRLTNSAPFAMVVDDFVDILPTTPGNVIYTTNTSKFNGVAISDPTISGATLTWTGVFLVPAATIRDLTFQVVLPNVTGVYTNQAVAHIGLTQIDTTAIISDNVPATAIVTIQPPPLVDLLKSVNPSSPQPPGTDLTYTIAFTNTGGLAATGLIVTDPIPANTDFKVGSVTSNLGTTGLTVVVEYSNDNGSTWTYTPVSGGGGGPVGYDRAVTDVRWSLTGNLSQTAPNNTGSLGFTVRIR